MTEPKEEEGQMNELALLFVCPTCTARVGSVCLTDLPDGATFHAERVAPIWVVFNVGKAWGLREARRRSTKKGATDE